jgi:hypothetical protein
MLQYLLGRRFDISIEWRRLTLRWADASGFAPRVTPFAPTADVQGVRSMRLPAIMIAATLITVSANAAELSGTLQKIKETNRIILGIQEASVPFSYLDGDQKVIGYAVDICLKIVDAVKRELNVSNVIVETLPVTSSIDSTHDEWNS